MNTRIFKQHQHPKYGNCLEGITGNGDKHLRPGMPGVYVTTESREMYVLTDADEYACWEHPDPEVGDVRLWNTHGTGELRWDVTLTDGRYSDGSYPRMNSNDLLGVKAFDLKLKGVSFARWEEILDAHLVKLEDLSELEIKLLKCASNLRSGSHSIVTEERVKLLEDEGEKWHHTIRNPPETGAVYDLQGKGLVTTTGSISGTVGQSNHIYRSTECYKITARGREILDKGKA